MRPTYDELPILDHSDLRHAWDVFGLEDALGTLNHLTDSRRLEATASVVEGRTVNLSLPLNEPSPAPFARSALRHEIYPTSSFSWDDRLTNLDMQASTQWDGLLHVRHREFGFYGGRHDDPAPADKLGIDRWVDHGIVGRGVLVDVENHLRSVGRQYDPLDVVAVTADDVRDALDSQHVVLREGDVLCLRFGWLGAVTQQVGDRRRDALDTSTGAGLHAGADTARLLWDAGVAAVATDNPAVEVQPGDREVGYLHHRLLTMLGMPLGELFVLDELATRCRRRGRWDFLFVSVPLNVPGAIGSPANALAVL